VTLKAWPPGVDVRQKPADENSMEGVGVRTAGNAVLVFDRGVEEVMWWSVYRLGGGRKLFDTHPRSTWPSAVTIRASRRWLWPTRSRPPVCA
jgi:hypothetical protein